MSIKQWDIDDTWTLFLDRDGVINKRIHGNYITGIDSFEFLAGAKQAIALLSNYFKLIVVVTNQQGIAKGIMTDSNLLDIHTYMCAQIDLAGGKIDECYFAPNLQGAEGDMRKPNSRMAELAKSEFPQIDYHKCVMVGDTDTDIQFGRNLGMKTVRIKTDEGIGYDADVTLDSLISFAKKLRNEI